jgi:hypothetical protein
MMTGCCGGWRSSVKAKPGRKYTSRDEAAGGVAKFAYDGTVQ